MEKTTGGTENIGTDIDFLLSEVGNAFAPSGHSRPTSYSNFVLDLTRVDKGIARRLPKEVIDFGYDLRKKTGKKPGTNESYCGTFIYLGQGENKEVLKLNDWLIWDDPSKTITIKNKAPAEILPYISNDEGSIFSIIDYCDVLSQVVFDSCGKIHRVQNPMKWQPNEIDGFYLSNISRTVTVYPVETKASSTGDDINLVQMNGQYETFINKMRNKQMTKALIRPIAIKMQDGGLNVAILEKNPLYNSVTNKAAPFFIIHNIVRIEFDPKIPSWG